MHLNHQTFRLAGGRRAACRVLASLALLALASATHAAPLPVATSQFTSGGKAITVEQFEPGKQGKFPAVLFLYGVDGIHKKNRDIFHGAARTVASQGYVVLLVHYHDRTGTGLQDAPVLMKRLQRFLQNPVAAGAEQQSMRKMYDDWKITVTDAVTHARKHARVDGDRVALVGYSLGGFLASSVAADRAQRISAVVTLFGGIPRDQGAVLKHFPPTLILGGDKDEVVPPEESHRLHRLLRGRKIPCEAVIYKGIGHGFTRDGKPHWTAALAQLKLIEFLGKRLAQKVASAPAARK